MIRKPKEKYEDCFSRLEWNKISAADPITSETAKNRRNDIFRRKQTKKTSTAELPRDFEVRKKRMIDIFRGKGQDDR